MPATATLAAAGARNAAAGRRRGRLGRAVDDLAGLLEVTRTIAGGRLGNGTNLVDFRIGPGGYRFTVLEDGPARWRMQVTRRPRPTG